MHRVIAQEMAHIYASRHMIDNTRAKMVWAAKEASIGTRRKNAAVHLDGKKKYSYH